jgi:hypothetical protein
MGRPTSRLFCGKWASQPSGANRRTRSAMTSRHDFVRRSQHNIDLDTRSVPRHAYPILLPFHESGAETSVPRLESPQEAP